MKTMNEWLDTAREKSGSDYKTAKALKVTPQAISDARKRKSIHNNTARKLAEYLGVNPLEIIASIEAEKHPEEAKNWQKWVACFVILSLVYFAEMPVFAGDLQAFVFLQVIHYAKWCAIIAIVSIVFLYLKNTKKKELT